MGLVAEYTFDNDTTGYCLDFSGNKYHGTTTLTASNYIQDL